MVGVCCILLKQEHANNVAVWQTQLKGRHANQSLLEYMASGNLMSKIFTPEDVFFGQLGGCLEMIDCGTTTVADYAHVNISVEHSKLLLMVGFLDCLPALADHKAISATVASGIRSSYGFAPNPRLSSTTPFEIDVNGLGGHSMPTLDELAKSSPWGDGRVTLGFAFDGFPFLPKEHIDPLMAKLAEYKIPLIQTHISWKPGKPSGPKMLEEKGILDDRWLMAHSNMTKEDADLYRKHGIHYSSTPSTEMQMALAFPVICFREDLGVEDLGSLGVDCHTNNAAFIPGEARIGLQGARAAKGQIAEKDGKMPNSIGPSIEEAFNLATIRGAHAMKMDKQIGSIAEGKFADLVIFDANSPSMICGALHDPVAAIILHSSPADIDTVIVDGVVRKQSGKLIDVKLDAGGEELAGKGSLSWPDVAKNLIRTRERIQEEAEKIDYKDGKRKVMQSFYMTDEDLAY